MIFDKIRCNVDYSTGLMATTDLHAGGLFFCIIYRKVLHFRDNGEVVLCEKLVDPFRPMDPVDVARIEKYRITGKYFKNGRGNLECQFEGLSMEGLPTELDERIVAFNVNGERIHGVSEVYIAANEIR